MAKQSATPINICDHCGKPIDDEYLVQISSRHVQTGPAGPVLTLFSLHGQCYEVVVAPLLDAALNETDGSV